MSQIINWLRKSSADFAYAVLDFGTSISQLEEEYPASKTREELEKYLNTYASGSRHAVALTKNVTLEELKEVIQKRYEVESSDYGPYEWQPLKDKVDVLVDRDNDGRALLFHQWFLPTMESVCETFGNDYVRAYSSIQKK